MRLTTEAQLAEEFGLDVEKVAELRRKHKWPCVRLGRFDVRYTDEQVTEIVAMHSERPAKTKPSAVAAAGQTARSASRRRSA